MDARTGGRAAGRAGGRTAGGRADRLGAVYALRQASRAGGGRRAGGPADGAAAALDGSACGGLAAHDEELGMFHNALYMILMRGAIELQARTDVRGAHRRVQALLEREAAAY